MVPLDQLRTAAACDPAMVVFTGAEVVALLAELDRLRERAQAAEDRAEMAAHNTRWGTR